MKRGYRCSHICFVLLSLLPGILAGQQYNIIKQGVCWTDTSGVDSSLTRLVYVSVSGAGPISVNYVNAQGASVDVSAGGDFSMGYCGCCADTAAIDFLYYVDGGRIENGDTILYRQYDNHVFLSQNGNNSTGRIGDFSRPFSDPWAAQDSISENNLSFIAYQGNYSYSGAGNGNEFTRVDTFLFQALPGAKNFSMLNITGSNSTPFVNDRTTAGFNSERKYIYINAPLSDFSMTDAGISIAAIGGVYNRNSQLYWKARKVSNFGGRNWGVQSAAKYTYVEFDSLEIGGQVAFSMSEDFTASAVAGTKQRYHTYKAGNVKAGTENTTDVSALFRVQTSTTAIDSNSVVVFDVKNAVANNSGFFAVINQKMYNTTIQADFGSLELTGTPGTDASVIVLNAAADSSWSNSNVNINIGYARNANVFRTGLSTLYPTTANNLKLSGNSRINININSAVSIGSGGKASIEIENVILQDSAEVYFNCDLCRFEGNKIPIRFTDCDFPAGTKFIMSGTYYFNQPGEVVFFATNTDLTGLQFQNANFINDGVSEWIQASGSTTITGASGIWSNSDSTINVAIQGNKLWGFSNCESDRIPLQDIIDGFCPPAYNGTAFATTDGSGDITVTIGATMLDATYTVLLSAQGSAFQHAQVQSQTTTTFVARFFDAAGAPITSTGVVLDWEVRDR